ncbi:MAG TPA: cellulase family glycosylhydrolase [Gammaproteobacteria bacterium]|nr:cellulase family glycosylhydrolase [Gammaproteobacteria bacterium]
MSGSAETFTPWGFNYNQDWEHRFIEDYWGDEWSRVEEDFDELQALGANVVRIYLQYRRFMDGPTSPNEINLSRLKDLVILAEDRGIYLDIVGLGSFRPEEDPAWYVDLSEPERWAAQATFWETIAETLADRPGVFAFNLMNEPVVSGERLERGAWVHPDEIEGLHYVQYINLDPNGRNRADIAVAWIRQMKRAIRTHDRQRPITVGMFPLLGSVDATGFSPRRLAAELDFISVHVYPETGRSDETLELLEGYDVGLPILIEEIFPLNIGLDEYRSFLDSSREIADGWVSFYWGETAEELAARAEPRAGLVRDAIVVFEEFKPR